MKIKVSEFAESRGIKSDTINAYMRRHGLVDANQKDKWSYDLDTDSEVYQILDKKYPFPKPVEVVEDKESKRRLIEVQEELANALSENIQLHERFTKAMTKVAELSAVQQLLEDKEKELTLAQFEIKQVTNELHEKDILLENVKHEKETLNTEIERLKTETDNEIYLLKEQLENEQNKNSKELSLAQFEAKQATRELHEKEILLTHEKHEKEMLSAEFERLKADSDEEIADLKKQLETEKNKSWIQKLFHK